MESRNNKIPTFDCFADFIRTQCKIYTNTQVEVTHNMPRCGNIPYVNNKDKSSRTLSRTQNTVHHAFLTRDINSNCNKNNCIMCNKDDHAHLYACSQFISLPAQRRFEFIKDKKGCINCLSLLHATFKCSSTNKCKICKKHHHTLLHFNNKNNSSDVSSDTQNINEQNITSMISSSAVTMSATQDASCSRPTTVLLSTAQVCVRTNNRTLCCCPLAYR